MSITSAKYTSSDNEVIAAVIDGGTVFVPVNNGNRHYNAIIEDGITIQAAP